MDLDKPQESAVTTSKIHFGSLAEGEEKKLAQGIHATRTEPTQHSKQNKNLKKKKISNHEFNIN